MAACGPFEPFPHVAVAVSGGADSLALLLLMHRWTRALGGKVRALTVDHGLRAESAAEAQQVALWATAAGIDHHILRWLGEKSGAGLQAAARQARYDLMTAWCRDAGVLHLATAHSLDDQRETVAMRQARGGPSQMGLAGMSLISTRSGVRLLRPLLPVPGALLRHHLTVLGQAWIEDPSNRLTRFERIRWREGREGALPQTADIRHWGEQRVADERAIADLFIRSVDIHAAGHVCVDLDPWKAVPDRWRIPALGQLIRLVAGADYQPAHGALARVAAGWLEAPRVTSLGGALIGHWRGRGLICREAAGVREKLTTSGLWDGRFAVDLAPNMTVGALGEPGVAEIGQSGHSQHWNRDIPPLARAALPAVRDATGRLMLVPYLGFDPYGRGSDTHFRFLPHNSATSSGFTVAYGWQHTI
ncbi:tRNA lysidine(34) synthetase TilS [Dongia rigui]|uniref:tRNA(Ile)-lysidine synthase n=1 Tax=Dongia rigui TaxID=940149 RepID=A0ABU5E380_9PROT|nr:tRNA lysidine(34) synthetase TilS [Dongia rigui]MDY0873271.1 tRNA lysidine(34) synthetase TilS [Dongia rigui]